jgi:hypothetical protein
MPVYKVAVPKGHPQHDELVAELVRHLGDGPDLPDFPKVYEEPIRLSKNITVTVIWPAWAAVREDERIQIVLEAYAQARGDSAMLAISSVFGLTPLEAKELGISFAV